MDTYDVLVVGAGIGGSLSARELCKRKKRVILIEKQPNYPKSKDTLVTKFEHIKAFDLPKEVIFNQGSKLTYGTYPELERASFTTKDAGIKDAIVLECNKFIETNIEFAIKVGCTYKVNEEIISIKKRKGFYEVALKNEKYIFQAKIIIDSSGIFCSVGRILGMFKQRFPVGYCHTFLTAGDNIKNYKEAFFEIERFDRWYWIYPISKKKSYAGLYTFISPEKYDDMLKDINSYLSKHGHEYTKHYNVECGLSFLNMFSPIKSRKIVHENVLFLGESGGTTTPLLGEGFRPICCCVEWLMENIDDVLDGRKKLSDVHDHFFSTVGKSYPIMRGILPFLLSLNHEQSRTLVKECLLKLEPVQLYRFTTVDCTNEEWRQIILSTMGILSKKDKLRLFSRHPVKAIQLVNLLKDRRIIKQVSELF